MFGECKNRRRSNREKVKVLLKEYSALKEKEERIREVLRDMLSVVEEEDVLKGVA